MPIVPCAGECESGSEDPRGLKSTLRAEQLFFALFAVVDFGGGLWAAERGDDFGFGFGDVGRNIGFGAGVETAVDVGVAEDDLDIAASFVEGDDLGKFGGFVEGTPSAPEGTPAGAGVVRGEGDFGFSTIVV